MITIAVRWYLRDGLSYRDVEELLGGGSFLDKRDFAMAGTLVRHPEGDLLIDTGFGKTIDQQFASMPAWFRRVTKWTVSTSAVQLFSEVGYDIDALRGILPTRTHWDHISGLPDFPGKAVYVTRQELDFVHRGGHGKFATPLTDIDWCIYDFEAGPYLGFGRSHDVYGDGSIVCVPAPGHTPGGVIVFVTLPNQARYALIGDLVREREPGLLEYVGRAKALIVRGGSNISPNEVEEAIRGHPGVVDVGVAGLPDPTLGQRVGALVVLTADASRPSIHDVVSWLGERLAAYKVPEQIRAVEAIPRNALTKIDRAAVRREIIRLAVLPDDVSS